MEKYNFMDHKFRASSFGDLMTGGKGISESQQKKVDKLEAITFLSVYHEDVFTNNKERREDDYFTGECDVEEGYDTKVSWSLNTLPDPEEPLKTIYEFQNRVYMRLWDRDKWTTSAIVMNMLEDQMKKEMYGEAWKWEDNEIPAWRKIEIIKLYIYEEDVFIKMCEDNDCLPNMEEYKRQLESEDEEVDPLLEKAAKMFMDFVEMPDHERIVEKTVERDMEIEENMVEIAKLSRQYMQDIEDEMYEKYLSNQ